MTAADDIERSLSPRARVASSARVAVAVALGVALATLPAACGDDSPTDTPTPGASLRVLFIGNSLTYTNDLPRMVERLAEASGESIATEMVAYPNFALEDHWGVGGARESVQGGDFDVVIMQQGPSSLPESREFLREWTRQWDLEIRATGGRSGLYAVWPDASRLFAFPDVSESYRLAAQDVEGLFFPVGDTWLATWGADPDAGLYSGDQFHPSVAGTYVAAVVIVSVLTGRDATTLSSALDVAGTSDGSLDAALAHQIRTAARNTIANLTPAGARRAVLAPPAR